MTDTNKKNLEHDWIALHTLTPEQVEQLLKAKFERAVKSQQAQRKRELLSDER